MHTVVVTGASGNMGRAVLSALGQREDLAVIGLAGPERGAPKRMRPFEGQPRLRIEYGDIRDPSLASRLAAQADTVLHCAALIPPAAEKDIRTTIQVNVGGMETWLGAIGRLAPPARPAFINVGSVAQTGDRNPPIHWGRVGDPVKFSAFDAYGITKAIAEWRLIEARLERWCSLRQTAILYPTIARSLDPQMFSFPLGGVLEWVTDSDTGRLAAVVCGPGAPAGLWGRVFNIGGGESARYTNFAFYDTLIRALGGPGLTPWTERRWFAAVNSHGQWFTDSGELASLTGFRGKPFGEQLAAIIAALPPSGRAAGLVPRPLMHEVFRFQAHTERGTMRWFDTRDAERVRHFFGSQAEWRAREDWATFVQPSPSRTPTYLDHGFDSAAPQASWTEATFKEAAGFRGGDFLGWEAADDPAYAGDLPRRRAWWRCARGHEFRALPLTILHAGYWCPRCIQDVRGYWRLRRESEFFAQVYPSQPA